MNIVIIFVIEFFLILTVAGCKTSNGYSTSQNSPGIDLSAGSNSLENTVPIAPPTPFQNKDNTDESKQLIRKIDFKNFTYPWFPLYTGNVRIKKEIVLQNGENETQSFSALPYGGPQTEFYQEYLDNVSYADLTGDGKEEAIVTVSVEFNRWLPGCIFIYTEDKGKAKLLWTYEINTLKTRLQWRGHKTSNGDLIIEEYDMKYGEPMECCPKRYLRKTFSWNGKSFQEKTREIIPFDKPVEIIGFPSDDSSN